MHSLGIQYEMSGWGTSGKAEEMEGYICCSLVCPWGMSRHEPDKKVLITLQPRLIWRKGTLFSPDWSSSNSITIGRLRENYTARTFDSLFDNPTTNFPTPPAVEILVPDCVPIGEFLPVLYFHSNASKDQAARNTSHLRFSNGNRVAETFDFQVNPYNFRGNM